MDSVLVSDARRSLPLDTRRSPRVVPPPRYAVDAISRPLTEFSGDFYFYLHVGDDLWFALGDFAGHGLQPAIYSAMIQEALPPAIRACEHVDPAEVMAVLHATVRPEFPFNRFASLVIGRLRPDGSLQLVNAGHCRPMLRRRDGMIEEIDSHGPVLGLLLHASWSQTTLTLAAGDAIVLHSDGLLEATNRRGVEVGSDKIRDWIRSGQAATMCSDLLTRFDTFTDGCQSDDVTLMVVSVGEETL